MQNALAERSRPLRPGHVASYLQHHRRELLGLLDSDAGAGAAFARRHAQVMDGLRNCDVGWASSLSLIRQN